MCLRRLEFPREPVHVVLVVVGALRVGRALGMARAPREVGGEGMLGRSRQRAPRDPVPVHVLVSLESPELLHVPVDVPARPQHLAAIERLLRIGEGIAHPVVHPEVEVHHHEDRRLEALRQVERLARHLGALLDASRDEQDVARVAVRQVVRRDDVPLHRPRRQAGRGADALDIEDDRGDLGVVAEPGELRHERDPGARSRRHGAGAGPRGAEHHPDRGQLVLRLHDRERGLAGLRIDAEAAAVVGERLRERGRRGDRVPSYHGNTRQHAADRGRGIAVDDDLARGRVHPLEAKRVRLLQVLPRPVEAAADRFQVDLDRLRLVLELLLDGALHLGHVDPEEPCGDSDVDHVDCEPPELAVLDELQDELLERDRVEVHVVPEAVELQALFVDHGRSGVDRPDVFVRGLRVHADEYPDVPAARDEALFGRADREPGRQALDVGREEVLSGHGDPHLEDRPHQDVVRRHASRAVGCRDVNRKVVDHRGSGLRGKRCLLFEDRRGHVSPLSTFALRRSQKS